MSGHDQAAGVGGAEPLHDPADPLPAEAEQLWEVNSGWWQRSFTEGADPEYTEQIIPLLADHLGQVAPRRVLDIGCGEGQLSRVAAGVPGVEQVVGVDPTEAQLNWPEGGLRAWPATGTLAGQAPAPAAGPRLRPGGRRGAAFPDATFDAAFACLVFEHIEGTVGGPGRGGPGAAPGRHLPAVLEPPPAPGPGQRMGGRPHPGGAVLAHRSLPGRAPRRRGGGQKRLDPLCPPAPFGLRQRPGRRRALPDGDGGAGPPGRLLGEGRRVPGGGRLPPALGTAGREVGARRRPTPAR